MPKKGRPRRKDVERYDCGKVREALVAPYNLNGVIPEEASLPNGDDRVVRFRRMTQLQRLHAAGTITGAQLDAGQEFYRIWNGWRLLYAGGPSMAAKVPSIYRRTNGHLAKLDNDELGIKFAAQYAATLRALGARLAALVKLVVLEGIEPIAANVPALSEGLMLLVKHYRITRG
jgi:hypothetical protein